MKHSILIIFFTVSALACALFCCGTKRADEPKTYTLVVLEQVVEVLSKVDGSGNAIMDESGRQVVTKVATCTTDSIVVYNYVNDRAEEYPLVVSLAPSPDKNRCILHFLIGNSIAKNQTRDSVEIAFESGNVVRAGADSYTLNAAYYLYLKQCLLDERNVALCEIIKGIPTFELLGVPQSEECGYCSYWYHVRESRRNRQRFAAAVRAWYQTNAPNMAWVESPMAVTGDCFSPVGGHYEVKRPTN